MNLGTLFRRGSLSSRGTLVIRGSLPVFRHSRHYRLALVARHSLLNRLAPT